MSSIKISELNAATSLGDADLFVIVQSGTSKKITADKVRLVRVFSDEYSLTTTTTITHNLGVLAKVVSFLEGDDNVILDWSNIDENSISVRIVNPITVTINIIA